MYINNIDNYKSIQIINIHIMSVHAHLQIPSRCLGLDLDNY